jgi:hypothetical protein
MHATFVCCACGHIKPINYRLKGGQVYCGEPACQRARKRAWQQHKMVTDISYRNHQIACLKRWRKKRPLHQYQKRYRELHSEYVQHNREQQRRRNHQRTSLLPASPIVKMDTLQPIKSGFYLLTPCVQNASEQIVKMDALLVELKSFQSPKPMTAVHPS